MTLRNRIEQNEAEIRRCRRRLDGTGRQEHGEHVPATGERRSRLEELLHDVEGSLELDREELRRHRDAGEAVWEPDDFEVGDEVQYWTGGQWFRVVRVNRKSITATTPHSWTQTVRYQDVKAHRRTPATQAPHRPPGGSN